jgi:preprotein translocase subunit SecD
VRVQIRFGTEVKRFCTAGPLINTHPKRKAPLKNFSWKLILVFAVIVAAVVYVLPTFEPGLWPHKQINLGLDLQGGMHLVLEVDTWK